MASFRIYLVPIVGTGTRTDPRRPKYFTDPLVNTKNYPWAGADYGFEPWMAVGATLDDPDDVSLAARADVTALPFNLEPTLTSAEVIAVKNNLEASNIPAGWVNTTLTWKEVVRTVLGVFKFLQRYGAIYAQENGSAPPSIFIGGVTLNTTFGSLSLAIQTALTDTATSFGIPTTGLTATTTLRQILKAMADNFQNEVYFFGNIAI